jgi:hypothetical protein
VALLVDAAVGLDVVDQERLPGPHRRAGGRCRGTAAAAPSPTPRARARRRP